MKREFLYSLTPNSARTRRFAQGGGGSAQTYEVFADGELLTCEPAEVLPLAQRYLLL